MGPVLHDPCCVQYPQFSCLLKVGVYSNGGGGGMFFGGRFQYIVCSLSILNANEIWKLVCYVAFVLRTRLHEEHRVQYFTSSLKEGL
jgi:hypothetical protein